MLNRTVGPILGLLTLVSSSALASNWYVNGARGNDRNSCTTTASTCATIGHAISLAASGDIINIAPSTYQENLTIPVNLTLHGVKAATTIVDGGNSGDGSNGGIVFTVGSGISLTLSNLTIQHGNTGFSPGAGGGGVDNAGTLTVNNSDFYVNTAVSGGAILNTGTAIISDTNFDSNSSLTYGYSSNCGAIDNQGTMTVSASTFYNNYANAYGTDGGAICNGGTLTIGSSTFNTNSSEGSGGAGGAIYTYAGTLAVTNSTFSLNTAPTSGSAIYSAGGTVQISNSTFGNGFVSIGGGGTIANAGGTIQIQDSILDNTANGGNCSGPITSNGYNMSSDASCGFSNAGDHNSTSPRLGALGNDGGPTQTMPLTNGSPAIDAGNPAGCRDFIGNLLTTDQRGKPRPGGTETTGCDLGAFETQSN